MYYIINVVSEEVKIVEAVADNAIVVSERGCTQLNYVYCTSILLTLDESREMFDIVDTVFVVVDGGRLGINYYSVPQCSCCSL